MKGIKEIYFKREKRLKRLTLFILYASAIPFVTYIITITLLFTLVENITEFKYSQGSEIRLDFYYALPFDTRIFILANYLYNLSYFLIPLHFYYLGKKKYILSFWCFLFSLNILLYGLAYFSRASVIHYVFLYGSFLYLLYNTLSRNTQKFIKVGSLFFLLIVGGYFVNVSIERFDPSGNDEALTRIYADNIPEGAIIQDPVTYSFLDYLSQWSLNSFYVLNDYNFETFNGQITMQPILRLLGQYKIIDNDPEKYKNLRRRIWPKNYYTFNGFTAYTVYDYGLFLSFVFCILYYLWMLFNKPINNRISVVKLFPMVLLIQLPLFAIFYSTVSGILMPFLFMIPIYFYCRISFRKRDLRKDLSLP